MERSESRATLEDLMYASVLEKFLTLGVDMLGSMDTITEDRNALKSLTEGIHSKVPPPPPPPGDGDLTVKSTPFLLVRVRTHGCSATQGCHQLVRHMDVARTCQELSGRLLMAVRME